MKQEALRTGKEPEGAEAVLNRDQLEAICRNIREAPDLDKTLERLRTSILSCFHAEHLALYRIAGEGRRMFGWMPGARAPGIRFPLSEESIPGYCTLKQTPVHVQGLPSREALATLDAGIRFDPARDRAWGISSREVLLVPIARRSVLLGAVELINPTGTGSFVPAQTSSLERLAAALAEQLFQREESGTNRQPRRRDLERLAGLIRRRVLTESQLRQASSRAAREGAFVESLLMEHYGVDKEAIGHALRQHYRVPFVAFTRSLRPETEILKGIKKGFLEHRMWVPLAGHRGLVHVAMADPKQLEPRRKEIEKLLRGRPFKPVVSTPADILAMIEHFYNLMDVEEDEAEDPPAISELLKGLQLELEDEEEEEPEEDDPDETSASIVNWVNKLIKQGIDRKASDIHLEPDENSRSVSVRFRVQGSCVPWMRYPLALHRGMAGRIKILASLDIAERRLPQEGRIDMKPPWGGRVALQVVVIPLVGGLEGVSMRFVEPAKPTVPLEQTGMAREAYEAFTRSMRSAGLILVCGARGKGVAEILQAAALHLDRPELRICSIPDEGEQGTACAGGAAVKPRIGLDQARAMRAVLQADPDVIRTGMLRDQEALSLAVEAALAGHLVLGGITARDAAEALVRTNDMGVHQVHLSTAVAAVMGLRNLRGICSACREEGPVTRALLEEVSAIVGPGAVPREDQGDGSELKVAGGRGCDACLGTGYSGAVGLHEVMVSTRALRRCIRAGKGAAALQAQAVKDGMVPLRQQAVDAFFQGRIDRKELLRFLQESDALERSRR